MPQYVVFFAKAKSKVDFIFSLSHALVICKEEIYYKVTVVFYSVMWYLCIAVVLHWHLGKVTP